MIVGERGRRAWYQLEDRHTGVLAARLVAVALVAAAATAAPAGLVAVDVPVVLAACGVAAALQLALWLLPVRHPRRLRLCVDLGIVVDVGWAAAVTAATGGIGGPGIALFLVTALLAALGYSARSGLKAATLATLAVAVLAWWDPDAAWSPAVAARLVFFWAVLAIGILGAAAGERELRRRAERLAVLHETAAALLTAPDRPAMEAIATTAAGRLMPGWRARMAAPEPDGRLVLARDGDAGVIRIPVPGPAGPRAGLELSGGRRRRSVHRVRLRDLDALRTVAAGLGGALWRADLVAELERQSLTDALTGLPNRRAFDSGLARILAEAGPAGAPVAVCLIDVDHFKRYNDTKGHRAGDAALAAVGAAIGGTARRDDLPARYGGEEFALVLPGAELAAALDVAERVRAAVAARDIPSGGVTVSIGVASADAPVSAEALTEAADAALYEAKAGGRDCVRGRVREPA